MTSEYEKDTRRWIFDLHIGDRFMYRGESVEVVSPWDYEGFPYGFGRILMDDEKVDPLTVYVVSTHDRSRIYPIKKNCLVEAY